MSSPALQLKTRPARRNRRPRLPAHIHLPSVHVRSKDGQSGFDYEEDIWIRGRLVTRRIRLAYTVYGAGVTVRTTTDVLCPEELEILREQLPILMDKDNPATMAMMEEAGREELARQLRIARGEEQACAGCGCSETRACSGGCCWATATLCSRCV